MLVQIVGGMDAFATMSDNLDPASRDILFNPRFEGDMQSIKPITNFLDKYIIRLISIIGFATILVAMLRNALSALVCVNYKFFMKIHQMKQDGAGQNGSFGQRLMASIIPDAIEFTDFEEGISSPKEYVLKAIPLAVVSVFIGSFIFSSYYRDTIGNFSVLGLHIVNRFVISRDYVGDFDKIVDMGTDYDFNFDKTPQGKQLTTISKKIYAVVRGAYGNINDTSAKADLGASIEQTVGSLQELKPFLGNPDYTMQFTVKATNSEVQPATPPGGMIQTDGDNKVFNYYYQMKQFVNPESNSSNIQETWLKLQVIFKPNVFKPGSNSSGQDGSATINVKWSKTSDNKAFRFNMPTGIEAGKKFGNISNARYRDSGSDKKYLIEINDQIVNIRSASKDKDLVLPDSVTLIYDGGTQIVYGSNPISELRLTRSNNDIAEVKITVGTQTVKYGEAIDFKQLDKDKTQGKDKPATDNSNKLNE